MSKIISQAVQLAIDRRIMPTNLGTGEIRELSRFMLDKSFWSARTTNSIYLKELKGLVERYVRGEGYNNDLGKVILEARALLAKIGYTPENGFPGDEELGIPPAEPGSLRDLSSDKRLSLIFETQASLMRGLGLKLRGLDRIDQFPAWELVRDEPREAPRDWEERWEQAGAAFVEVDGIRRMIAPKDAEVWSALGDSALFDDALDVDHPPFAFNSGMGWEEVDYNSWAKVREQWTGIEEVPLDEADMPVWSESNPSPAASSFIGGDATLDRLLAELRARQKAAGLQP